jgi:hypothetical protein
VGTGKVKCVDWEGFALKMQCSRRFFFQMCLSLLVSTGSCRCKSLNDVLQSEAPESFTETSKQDFVEKEEMDSRLQSFLENMKEGFLRELNLSDIPQEHIKIYPPPFMIELYNKYASDKSAMPRSDVIRSFTVQGMYIGKSNRNIGGKTYATGFFFKSVITTFTSYSGFRKYSQIFTPLDILDNLLCYKVGLKWI